MAQASAYRANYQDEYLYFIQANGRRTEADGLNPDGTPFSIRLVSPESEGVPPVETTEQLAAFLANHAVLTVLASKSQIVANGVDSVSWTIAGQTSFSYILLKENIQIATGAVADGSLVFQTDIPALYNVELKIGEATGYSQVEAL